MVPFILLCSQSDIRGPRLLFILTCVNRNNGSKSAPPNAGVQLTPPHSLCAVQKWREMPGFLPKASLAAGWRGGWVEAGAVMERGLLQKPISTTFPSTDGGKLPDLTTAGSQIQQFATGHQAGGARPAAQLQLGCSSTWWLRNDVSWLLKIIIIVSRDWLHSLASH